jgi:hypothetical protein
MPRLFRRVSFRWILYSLGISYSERVPRSRCCQSNKNLANVRQATSINALDFYRYKTKKFLVQRTFASWRLVSGFVVSTFVVEGVLSACDAAEDTASATRRAQMRSEEMFSSATRMALVTSEEMISMATRVTLVTAETMFSSVTMKALVTSDKTLSSVTGNVRT